MITTVSNETIIKTVEDFIDYLKYYGTDQVPSENGKRISQGVVEEGEVDKIDGGYGNPIRNFRLLKVIIRPEKEDKLAQISIEITIRAQLIEKPKGD
jgi:hypothetical protein